MNAIEVLTTGSQCAMELIPHRYNFRRYRTSLGISSLEALPERSDSGFSKPEPDLTPKVLRINVHFVRRCYTIGWSSENGHS